METHTENNESPEEVASMPQSYAFTVHFDSRKQSQSSEVEAINKFARRHIRNLSLPISKVYENKVCTLNILLYYFVI